MEQFEIRQGKREAAREIFLYIMALETDEAGTLLGKAGTQGSLLNWILNTYHPDLSDRDIEVMENT